MAPPLRARVRNGRYVIEEPANEPEGAEVFFVPVDGEDELDDEEREALHESLRESIAQMKAGKFVDGEKLLERLRRET